MCCFSGPVLDVSSTRIFARRDGERQILVYQMKYSAKEPLAMILPIPTIKNAVEGDVKFFNLESYPEFFDNLHASFPAWTTKGRGRSFNMLGTFNDTIEVHDVGKFEASFVPSLADFSRLDKRFKLPDGTFEQIPDYKAYGFAVFKLKATNENEEVHPMAFSFKTQQMSNELFFPTMHIHDMKIHEYEKFGHSIYLQSARFDREGLAKKINKSRKVPLSPGPFSIQGQVEETYKSLRNHLQVDKIQDIVDPDSKAYGFKMYGEFHNQDIYVS